MEIRSTTADEFADYARFGRLPYGHDVSDATIEAWRQRIDYGRMLVAADASGIVGTAGTLEFSMTVPGGNTLACAGVAAVAVRPDRRRRGILRQLMGEVLRGIRQRGEPLAALYASESAIYGRFGFGPAVPCVDFAVERGWATLRTTPGVEPQLVDASQAAEALASIRERERRRRPGMLTRDAAEWHLVASHDPPAERDGAGPRQIAVIDGRGYVVWRLQPSWQPTGHEGTVVVEELLAVDDQAWAGLWSFVLSMDLSARLTARRRPLDDPLPHLLTSAQRVQVTAGAPMYARLVDIAACLQARSYRGDARVVLDVTDATLPDQQGGYLLEVAADGGVSVDRLGALGTPVGHGQVVPRISLDVEDLAAVYLGGLKVAALASAGRIHGQPDAIDAFDAMLGCSLAPWQDGGY